MDKVQNVMDASQPDPPKRFVVAGSFKQHVRFCMEKGWNPYKEAHYISENWGSQILRGLHGGFEVYYVGTYDERRDLDEIHDVVKAYEGVEKY